MAGIHATRDAGEGSSGLRFQSDDAPTVDTETALAALNDPDCRELLAAATGEARTASELIEDCDIPRSTAYRKIDRLTDAGLYEESIRVSTDGTHASEYRRTVERLTVSLAADDGLEVATPPCD